MVLYVVFTSSVQNILCVSCIFKNLYLQKKEEHINLDEEEVDYYKIKVKWRSGKTRISISEAAHRELVHSFITRVVSNEIYPMEVYGIDPKGSRTEIGLETPMKVLQKFCIKELEIFVKDEPQAVCPGKMHLNC